METSIRDWRFPLPVRTGIVFRDLDLFDRTSIVADSKVKRELNLRNSVDLEEVSPGSSLVPDLKALTIATDLDGDGGYKNFDGDGR